MNYDTVCDFAQTPSTNSLQELEGRNHEDTRMSPLGVEPLSAERLAATKVTTMNAESDTVPQHEILPEMSCIACPLHVAMEKIAHSAVQQCVLYLQGECQPRPTLLQELDDWISLHALIRSHICVASRSATISLTIWKRRWTGWFPSHPIPPFRYSVSIFATRWWPACGQPVVLWNVAPHISSSTASSAI